MKQTYEAFCNSKQLTPVPDAAKAYVDDSLSVREISEHYTEVFLASLHPDGGNLAGFHGVGAAEGEGSDE